MVCKQNLLQTEWEKYLETVYKDYTMPPEQYRQLKSTFHAGAIVSFLAIISAYQEGRAKEMTLQLKDKLNKFAKKLEQQDDEKSS